MAKPERWKRMKRDAAKYFDENPKLSGTRDEFGPYQRKRGFTFNDDHWTSLWALEATPAHVVEGYVSYFNERYAKSRQLNIVEDFEDCDAPVPNEERQQRDIITHAGELLGEKKSFWDQATDVVLRVASAPLLRRRFFKQQPEQAFCANAADVYLAATKVVESVGNLSSKKKLSTPEAIVLGEKVMDRTVQQYADWLESIWRVDRRTIMFCFSNTRKKDPMKRMEVIVDIPLTVEAYDTFISGDLAQNEITSKHIDTRSGRHFLNAMSNPPAGFRAVKRLGIAQIRTLVFQLASFTPPIVRGNRPRVAIFDAIPVNKERAERHGFEEIGTQLKGEAFNIMELRPDEEQVPRPGIVSSLLYTIVCSAVQHVQRILDED